MRRFQIFIILPFSLSFVETGHLWPSRLSAKIRYMAEQVLQEIKDRLNIVDVISSYINLKKAGANFKAPCPFHSEKSASLMVSSQKQIWHCFGCGEGGDVFGFVMKYENLEFREAMKILAGKAGVNLPEYRPPDPKQQSEKELLL